MGKQDEGEIENYLMSTEFQFFKTKKNSRKFCYTTVRIQQILLNYVLEVGERQILCFLPQLKMKKINNAEVEKI